MAWLLYKRNTKWISFLILCLLDGPKVSDWENSVGEKKGGGKGNLDQDNQVPLLSHIISNYLNVLCLDILLFYLFIFLKHFNWCNYYYYYWDTTPIQTGKYLYKLVLFCFQLRLVPSSSKNPLFIQTFEESYTLYKKYQMAIHQDTPERCTENQFNRFLVKNPFQVKYLEIKLNFSLVKISYALLTHVYT